MVLETQIIKLLPIQEEAIPVEGRQDRLSTSEKK